MVRELGGWSLCLLLLSGTQMNFLGHLYVSGNDPLVIVGNFMADAVKGRDLSRFPEAVQKGIRLHRAIDSFTDDHPLVAAGKQRVREKAGRYAPVVMDLFYDHLLAAHWHKWHNEKLSAFTDRIYALLRQHMDILPDRTRHMLPYMIAGDWLGSYATMNGLGRALQGMARRVKGGSAMEGAEQVLAGALDAYLLEFDRFLPELNEHVTPLR